MKKTLSNDSMTAFIGWCVGTARFLPKLKPETVILIDRLIVDTISVHVKALIDAIPEDDEPCGHHEVGGCPDMIRSCSNSLIEFAHQVHTIEEFDVICETEWCLYRYFCEVIKETPQDKYEHRKSFCKAAAVDFIKTLSQDLVSPGNPLSQIAVAMQVSSSAAELIEQLSAAFMDERFFTEEFYKRKLSIVTADNSTELKLIDQDNNPTCSSHDDWPMFIDHHGKENIH